MDNALIFLIDQTNGGVVDKELMRRAAKAFKRQVEDLRQHWPVPSKVSIEVYDEAKPPGPDVWQVILVDKLDQEELGFHYNEHGTPRAKIFVDPKSEKDKEKWTVAASHEILEMLVDPTGNRLQVGEAVKCVDGQIRKGTGYVPYLVEVCDACEADNFSYKVEGIHVSDFVTPEFYGPKKGEGTLYSFNDHVKEPRTIAPGGYLTWVQPNSAEVRQMIWLDPNGLPQVRAVGGLETASLRQHVDSQTAYLLRAARTFRFKPFEIKPGETTDKFKCDYDHWVTYHVGEGQIEVHDLNSDSRRQEPVRQHQAVLRPPGHHEVKNLSNTLLLGGKDLIDPQTLR